MARIRTIKPYKKQPIPSAIKREVAKKYGVNPGGTFVSHACEALCGFVGHIHWILNSPKCLGHVSLSGLEFDHIKPEFCGGKADVSNLQLLCVRCNRIKGCK